jgi:hypothetical protein
MLSLPPTQLPNGSRFGVSEWIARFVVSVLFMLGMLAAATATPTRVEGETDLSVECGEDSETVEQVDVEANTPTRRSCAGTHAPMSTVERLRPPRSLSPHRRHAPRRSWHGPRRTAPDDDDDDDDDTLT